MKTLQKVVLALVIGVIITLAIAFVAPNSVSAAKNTAVLGGINIDGYCRATYSYYPYSGRAILMGSNAYLWRCDVKRYNGPYAYPMFSYSYPSIDLNAACRWQYGGSAYAKTNNPSSPYSWQCYL
jgi:O-glycosyl hydrolase